ncbi:Polyketide cyclase / dehydrase and lipid transport protein [Zea mays]|uniref:Polyketide cyclase / dehydrase and lipid transport protein n=1 Tax=Zea mays TaxID=4577 RepID=A0A1D6N098_MAIZE|nr:Polyketide cyclase / dehydrase and lipid transport protein [Zea mays]
MATSSCYCVSSHGHGLSRAGPARLRIARLHLHLVFPSTPSPRLSSRRIPASPDPPLDVAAGDATGEVDWPAPNDDQDQEQEDRDEGIGFHIQVSKVGKRNRRLVRARVRVHAPLEAVWATLTDYEGLADFIPGLSECRLLDRHDGFARLYQPVNASLNERGDFSCGGQVGEQDLALGFKFNAKGTVDCYEGDIELLPAAGARRREIAFNMIDGDFKLFQGKWSVEEAGGENSEEQELETTLSYVVELEPKLWVPVRLLEGRICSEIKNNLVSIREQAHNRRIQRLQHEL